MDVDYRKDKTEKVLSKYRDLVDKIFTVVDMDKLEDEIRKAETDEESEAKLLTKVNNRKKALEHIEDLLERIDRLENKQNDNDGAESPANENIHPTKRFARK